MKTRFNTQPFACLGTENSGKNSLIEKLIQRKKREFALPQLKQKNALSFNHMSAVDEATEGKTNI